MLDGAQGAGETPTPPAIAAGYSTTIKGGKVQLRIIGVL